MTAADASKPPPPATPVPLIYYVFVGMAALDVVAPVFVFVPVFVSRGPPDEVFFVVLGAMLAQGGLLVAWSVLGPGRVAVRLFVSFIIAFFVWSLIILGFSLHRPEESYWSEEIIDFARAFLMLPLFFFVAQAPVWLMKFLRGWHIVPRDVPQYVSSAAARQFGMLHVFVATTVVAVALAVAPFGVPVPRGRTPDPIRDIWVPLLSISLFVVIWSTVGTLTCLWAAMRARRPLLGLAVVVILPAVITAVVFLGVMASTGETLSWREILPVISLHCGLLVVMYVVLRVARYCGYELRSVRSGRGESSPGKPPDAPVKTGG